MRGTANGWRLAAVLVAVAVWQGVGSAPPRPSPEPSPSTGRPPTLKPLAMDADPVCAKKHTGPVPSEMLVLGSGNTMAQHHGLGLEGAPGREDLSRSQDSRGPRSERLQYVPHVMGIMVGQPYKILNSDGVLHNIHTLPKINTPFNKGMPATLKEATTMFDKPEEVFQIKCDVHPWMSAYMAVFTHPFFSVTSTDGKFTISGLDPGTYEITAWHERLGTQTATVTVGASDTKTQNFKFAVPPRSSDPERQPHE